MTPYETVLEAARVRTLDEAEKAILAAGPVVEPDLSSLLKEQFDKAASHKGGSVAIPIDALSTLLGFDPNDVTGQALRQMPGAEIVKMGGTGLIDIVSGKPIDVMKRTLGAVVPTGTDPYNNATDVEVPND